MPRCKAPVIPDDLLDQLLAGDDAGTALNSGGLLDALLSSPRRPSSTIRILSSAA
jgi:hypothetical protein